jgi:hypothetical protein
MIKGITGSNGIAVEGGNTSVPFVNANINNPMTGMIRIHGTDMQVFDGSGWLSMSTSYATVELDTESKNLLEWTKKKKSEEAALISLPSDHPAVKVAKENLNKAKQEVKRLEEQLRITEILIHEESTS